jgi:hypothetical protein
MDMIQHQTQERQHRKGNMATTQTAPPHAGWFPDPDNPSPAGRYWEEGNGRRAAQDGIYVDASGQYLSENGEPLSQEDL